MGQLSGSDWTTICGVLQKLPSRIGGTATHSEHSSSKRRSHGCAPRTKYMTRYDV